MRIEQDVKFCHIYDRNLPGAYCGVSKLLANHVAGLASKMPYRRGTSVCPWCEQPHCPICTGRVDRLLKERAA